MTEEIRLIGPSGRTIYRWGPEPRRMVGAMDLTTEVDMVDDAVFDETGTFVASFILDGEIVGEIEVPVYVQSAPAKLPKDTEDGLKKSDVIWVGTESPNGRRKTVPAWFAYKNGKIYVLSQREPGPEEQTVPGVPDAQRARGDHAAEAPRHLARGVLRGAAHARGRRSGKRRRSSWSTSGRAAPAPPAESLDPLARDLPTSSSSRPNVAVVTAAQRFTGRPTAAATASSSLTEQRPSRRA